MFTETTINQFILKLRLQAVIEGIDEKAALSYAATRLRLATGEITKPEYDTLVDETNHIFAIPSESESDHSSALNRWIEQQIDELKITQLS